LKNTNFDKKNSKILIKFTKLIPIHEFVLKKKLQKLNTSINK